VKIEHQSRAWLSKVIGGNF